MSIKKRQILLDLPVKYFSLTKKKKERNKSAVDTYIECFQLIKNKKAYY